MRVAAIARIAAPRSNPAKVYPPDGVRVETAYVKVLNTSVTRAIELFDSSAGKAGEGFLVPAKGEYAAIIGGEEELFVLTVGEGSDEASVAVSQTRAG